MKKILIAMLVAIMVVDAAEASRASRRRYRRRRAAEQALLAANAVKIHHPNANPTTTWIKPSMPNTTSYLDISNNGTVTLVWDMASHQYSR